MGYQRRVHGSSTGVESLETVTKYKSAKMKADADIGEAKETMKKEEHDSAKLNATGTTMVTKSNAASEFLSKNGRATAEAIVERVSGEAKEREPKVAENKEKLAHITALTSDAGKQFEIQQAQLKELLAKIQSAKEQYKMLHPELEKERKHILEKAQADALAESVKIKDQAEAMAKEMMKKAHENVVATTHKAFLVAQSERKEAAEALEKAKEVR